jgi:putative oxidoreductase
MWFHKVLLDERWVWRDHVRVMTEIKESQMYFNNWTPRAL